MKDWLGNELEIGGLVLYSSSSKYVGMMLGELTYFDEKMIKIKPWAYSGSRSRANKIIVLHKGDGAFASVTRYFGMVPITDNNE